MASVRNPICRLLSSAAKVVGPGEYDAVVALQRFHEAGAAQGFGVESFGGQEEDAEIGGVGRREVF